MRFANDFLQKTAHIGIFQTILINDAHHMTPAAANALLKTLEEPSDNSVILLLSEDADMLLPTIISRCRVINIRSLVGEALLKSIQGNNQNLNSSLNDPLNEFMYVNSTHMTELTNEEQQAQYQTFKSLLLSFLASPEDAKALQKLLITNTHALGWLEKIIVNITRLRLTLSNDDVWITDNIQLSNLPSSEILNQIYKMMTNSSKLIKSITQTNQQFVLEKLVVEIRQLLKTHS